MPFAEGDCNGKLGTDTIGICPKNDVFNLKFALQDLVQMKEIAFPVSVPVEVAWGDMDAFNHVNNVVYFRYFETARIRYFEVLQLMKLMNEKACGPILAHTSCNFVKPLSYPASVKAESAVLKIGNSSFEMLYRIVDSKGNIVADGKGIVVMINYKTGEKVAISDEMKAAICELQQCKLSDLQKS